MRHSEKIAVFIAVCMLFFHVELVDIKSDFDSGASVEVVIQKAVDKGINIELIVSQLVALSPATARQIVAAAGTLPAALQPSIIAPVDVPNIASGA